MKTVYQHGCLLIKPETDFEEGFLYENYSGDNFDGFLKHGVTPAELVGLVIVPRKKE